MTNTITILTGIMILTGAIIMLLPIFNTGKILKQIGREKHHTKWKVLLSLMIFFVVGYLAAVYLVFSGKFESLYVITGIVFFFGALFVALVTRLGYLTIKDLGKAAEEVKKELSIRLLYEYEMKNTRDNLRKHNAALLDLVKKINKNSKEAIDMVKQITKYCSEVVNVERVSVWLFNESRSSISCFDLYEKTPKKHSSGVVLYAKDYPNYFAALEECRVIDAHNAHTDPRTKEYSEPYLTPLGISSMLDAPVWGAGKLIGILCIEHVGPLRTWSSEEQVFAGSIADIVSLAMETSERTKTLKELKEREQHLSLVYDTVGDVIFVLDLEGERFKFSSVNKAFAKTTGLSERDVIGTYVDEIIPESSLKLVLSKYKEAIKENKVVMWEETSEYPKGTLVGEVSVAPIYDENGKCTSLVGSIHDISERKKAQENLEIKVNERTGKLLETNKTLIDEIERRKKAEDQKIIYENIVKNIPIGLTIIQFENLEDPKTLKIIDGNAAAEKFINVKKEDYVGRYLKDFSPDTFTSGRYKIYEQVVKTGKTIDLGVIHYPGNAFIPENHFRMTAFPLPENTVVVTVENVSELIRTEEKFQSVVEASPNALLMVDQNGSISLANQEAERLFGYSKEELMRTVYVKLVPQRLIPDALNDLKLFFKEPDNISRFHQKEGLGRKKNGDEVPVEISFNPVHSKKGTFLLASIMDISERKKNQEQIKVYEDIVKNIPIGLDIMKFEDLSNTSTLKVVTTNPAFDKFSGVKGKDIVNKYVKDIAPEVFANGKDKIYQKMLKTGQPKDFGTVHISANGHPESYIHESAFPVSENYVAVSYENVTEQIKTEERFRLVVESSGHAILMSDKSGKIVLANSKSEKLFGYKREELIGNDIGLLFPERSRKEFYEDQIRFFEQPDERIKREKSREYKGLKKNGEEIPVELSFAPIYTENKVFMLSAMIDISDRIAAEAKLKESEERFRSIAEYAPVVLIRVNKDGIIEYINKVSNKFKKQDVIGKPVFDFVHSDSVALYRSKLNEVFATGNPVSLELKGFRDDASMGWYSVMMAPIRMGNEMNSVVIILLDITERKLADEEIAFLYKNLEKNLADLEVANKELESFSYSVSHDLRAPLRSIQGYSLVLQNEHKEHLDEDANHLLSVIIANSKKMGQLIDDLLAFSRLGKKGIQKSKVDIKEMLQAILQEIDIYSWNKNSELVIKDPHPAYGDPVLLHQVFYNLISNALKYSKNKSKPIVEIGSYTKGTDTIYYVRDNGVGFDMKYYDKLFKVFQRLHRPDEFEGTGIGLAIIEKIVTRHGGRVWAVSKVNEGATFFVSLPNEPENTTE